MEINKKLNQRSQRASDGFQVRRQSWKELGLRHCASDLTPKARSEDSPAGLRGLSFVNVN
jgi:hypothetical protein